MDIRHEEFPGGGGAFAAGEGQDRAELTYAAAAGGEALVFDHTYVPGHLRGRGLAERLVEAGVAHARARGLRIVPRCSYVAALFQRRPERYADVQAGGTT